MRIGNETNVKINKFFVLDTLKHWTNGTCEMDKQKLKGIVEKRVDAFIKFVFETE